MRRFVTVSVLELQCALKVRGYEIECDGIAGPRTEHAYVQWSSDSAAFTPARNPPGFVAASIDLPGAQALGLAPPCTHPDPLPLATLAQRVWLARAGETPAAWCPDCGALRTIHLDWRLPGEKTR